MVLCDPKLCSKVLCCSWCSPYGLMKLELSHLSCSLVRLQSEGGRVLVTGRYLCSDSYFKALGFCAVLVLWFIFWVVHLRLSSQDCWPVGWSVDSTYCSALSYWLHALLHEYCWSSVSLWSTAWLLLARPLPTVESNSNWPREEDRIVHGCPYVWR